MAEEKKPAEQESAKTTAKLPQERKQLQPKRRQNRTESKGER